MLSGEGSNAGKVGGKKMRMRSSRVGLSHGGNGCTVGGPSWGTEPSGEYLVAKN